MLSLSKITESRSMIIMAVAHYDSFEIVEGKAQLPCIEDEAIIGTSIKEDPVASCIHKKTETMAASERLVTGKIILHQNCNAKQSNLLSGRQQPSRYSPESV